MRQVIKLIGIALVIIVIVNVINHNKKDEYPRIRVIASSDEESDQAEKYQVVDLLLKLIEQYDYQDKLANKKVQNDLLEEIKAIVKKDVTIEYEKIAYPAKTLKGKFIASGNYDTLIVRLGEAKGKNWWSILYPEYYGLSYEDRLAFEEIEYQSYIYEKWIKPKNK